MALVQLEEGPRMFGDLVDAAPADVAIDTPLVVTFDPAPDGSFAIPRWRLAGGPRMTTMRSAVEGGDRYRVAREALAEIPMRGRARRRGRRRDPLVRDGDGDVRLVRPAADGDRAPSRARGRAPRSRRAASSACRCSHADQLDVATLAGKSASAPDKWAALGLPVRAAARGIHRARAGRRVRRRVVPGRGAAGDRRPHAVRRRRRRVPAPSRGRRRAARPLPPPVCRAWATSCRREAPEGYPT